ncbi:MAG: hypothetical protein AB7V48_10230 [Sedimentibacter sp.]
MKIINLKNYYPFYKADFFIEVSDEIVELFTQFNRKEHSDFERRRVHKAYYSLDAGDNIEKDVVLLGLSPEESYERKFNKQKLYASFLNFFRKVWQFCNSHRSSGERGTKKSPPERG